MWYLEFQLKLQKALGVGLVPEAEDAVEPLG